MMHLLATSMTQRAVSITRRYEELPLKSVIISESFHDPKTVSASLRDESTPWVSS
jgi:hypothetical protein